mgnify:FL=1|jgi:uncharacterized membrane protein
MDPLDDGKEMTILKGPDGKDSSKRFWGSLMLGSGVAVLVINAIVGFFTIPPGLEAIKYSGGFLISGGAALLGFGTLFERFGKPPVPKPVDKGGA